MVCRVLSVVFFIVAPVETEESTSLPLPAIFGRSDEIGEGAAGRYVMPDVNDMARVNIGAWDGVEVEVIGGGRGGAVTKGGAARSGRTTAGEERPSGFGESVVMLRANGLL